jgi:hypothetical protein
MNQKYLLLSALIFFTIIYTNSNHFILSNQEFFPNVYGQLLPLPLPTLSNNPIEANINDEKFGNFTVSRFDHQNAVECRGDINTGSRICLPYTFNIDGNASGKFKVINETIIPTGEWKFKCSTIKQGGVFFFPPLVLDFALNADVDTDKVKFFYKLDDPDKGRISMFAMANHPISGIPCEVHVTYFVGDIVLRTGLIPARDTGLQGVFKNAIYSTDEAGNIISSNKTSTSKNFGNIDGFGEISRSVGSEWNFSLINKLIQVAVNSSELNLFPQIHNTSDSSEITIKVKNSDGSPVANEEVEVETCTKVESGGHPHDLRINNCDDTSRPKAILSYNNEQSNLIKVITDSKGEAKIFYRSPEIIDNSNNSKIYRISGNDTIKASLTKDSSVKNESKTIVTKVPNLIRMPNSETCEGDSNTYIFEAQSNHDCIFYGTENTNNDLIQIAEEFNKRQIDCSNASKPEDEPACDVTIEGLQKKDFVTINTNNIIPIKINAMSLPWGGLLDKNGDWSTPYFDHNDGNQADLSFDINGTEMNIDQKKLLRDVIIDSGQLLPNSGEGKENDVSLAKDHFHVQFVGCSINSNSLVAMQSSTNICENKVEGMIVSTTNDRELLNIEGIRVQLCSDINIKLLCSISQGLTDYTDSSGKFQFNLPSDVDVKDIKYIKIMLINEASSMLVTHSDKTPLRSPGEIKIFNPKIVTSGDHYKLDVSFLSNGIRINEMEVDLLDINAGNIPIQTLSNLLSIFHYTNRALDFTVKELKQTIGLNLPLEVRAFTQRGSSAASVFEERPVPTIWLNHQKSDLNYANPNEIAKGLLSLFHEFGHFVNYEISGDPNFGTRQVHPDLRSIIIFPQCHLGYGNIDSSCSLSEGRATFISFLIKDKVLDDSKHLFYKTFLKMPPNFDIDLESKKHIVGKLISTKPPIFEWDRFAEENSISSLLWDLYDNTRKEESISIHPGLIIETTFISNTLDDLYKRLIDFKIVNKNQLNALFADFGICIDRNQHNSLGICNTKEVNGRSSWTASYEPMGLDREILFGYEERP